MNTNFWCLVIVEVCQEKRVFEKIECNIDIIVEEGVIMIGMKTASINLQVIIG